MALIKCEECQREISDKAEICPHCGFPIYVEEEEVHGHGKGCLVIVTIFILFGAMIFWQSLSNNEQEATKNVLKQTINKPVTVVDKEIQVEEDYYWSITIPINTNSELTVNYTVKSGPPIDVYFLDEDNFKLYQSVMQSNENVPIYYFKELSSFGTVTSKRNEVLNKGIYYLVIDNTDYGKTYPPFNMENDIATLDLIITSKTVN